MRTEAIPNDTSPLRTVPIYLDYAHHIMAHCPKAWVINYTNPMTLCVAALYAAEPSIKRVLGVDMSLAALDAARRRMGLLPNAAIQGRISLLQALATNPDPRFLGFDAVTAVEVIEHLDTAHLVAFGRVVFGYLQPALVILTTPNFEYNVRWNAVPALRRKDHRFEWTRSQFQEWTSNFAGRHQYACEFTEIGSSFGQMGGPTQMVTCSRLSDEAHPC